MKRNLFVFALAMTLLMATVLGAFAEDQVKVVFLVKQMGNDFWVELVDAAKEKAEELNVDLEVLCPLTADSNEEQIQLIEQTLLDPPDVYVIAPADSNGIVPAIEQINELDLPVIILDSPVTSEEVETLTFIGSNNVNLGYDLAYAAARLTGKEAGNVVLIEGRTGQASSIDRTAGAEKAYEELGWNFLEKQPGNWSRDDSYNAVQNLLQKYDNIDVIQFNSVTMALGAYDAVDKSGRDIKMVAVDKNSEVLQLMLDTDSKIMMALIDNPPDYMGKTAIEIAVAYCAGEEIESSYTTSGEIIAQTEENWQSYLDKYGLSK